MKRGSVKLTQFRVGLSEPYYLAYSFLGATGNFPASGFALPCSSGRPVALS